MALKKVIEEVEKEIWIRLYDDGDTYLKRRQYVDNGDKVRISWIKGVFDKGYVPNWSREQFTVSLKVPQTDKTARNSRPVYTLTYESGEDLRGKWYSEEIQHIPDNDYEVERVLKRRTAADGTKELFVKWKDYLAKYNSWIKEQHVST